MKIRLVSISRRYKERVLDLPVEIRTIEDVMVAENLNPPEQAASVTSVGDDMSKVRTLDYELKDGDRLAIYPTEREVHTGSRASGKTKK